MTKAEMYEKLGTYLVENVEVTEKELKDLLSRVDLSKGVTLEKLLLEEARLGEDKLALAKSMVLGIPYCDVDRVEIKAEILKMITKEKALKYCSLPIGFDECDPSVIGIVTDDPQDFDKANDLRIIMDHEVRFYLGTREAILRKIEACYAGEAPVNGKQGVLKAASTADKQGDPKAVVSGKPEGSAETIGDEIVRYDVNEEFAHSGIIKAGDFYYLGYCVGNVGGTIEEQVNGAFDHMEKRLKMVGLTLENVIQMDCLFRDVWNIPVMERVIKNRFHGKYPVRKSIQTNFVHVGGENGLLFQVDGIAYAKK